MPYSAPSASKHPGAHQVAFVSWLLELLSPGTVSLISLVFGVLDGVECQLGTLETAPSSVSSVFLVVRLGGGFGEEDRQNALFITP